MRITEVKAKSDTHKNKITNIKVNGNFIELYSMYDSGHLKLWLFCYFR